jgi:Tfp pilus assembly protein PilV
MVVFSASDLHKYHQHVKTTFPTDFPPRRSYPCRALTILEMLVSTALLSFIVLGLTAMFIQTQKAFKSGIKRTTVTDAGRAIADMIASDLSQMADGQITNQNVPNVVAPNSTSFIYPNLAWSWVPQYDLYQYQNGAVFRVNQVQDIFALVLTNNTWLGVGYTVSNWFTNSSGAAIPGVGTLYRYVTNVTAPLTVSNASILYQQGFQNAIAYGTFTNCHRIADGVVHLKIYTYDANGYENQNEIISYNNPNLISNKYPNYVLITNSAGFATNQLNFVPHAIDIELGILEPEALEHARALYTAGATVAASNYLANAAGQVEIFRQHIIIAGGAP